MGLVVFHVIFSVIAITLFNLLAFLGKRVWAWVIFGGLWVLWSLASLPSLIASCQMALLTVVGLIMASRGVRAQRWYLLCSVAIVLTVYGLCYVAGQSALRAFDELRQRYPFISMSE